MKFFAFPSEGKNHMDKMLYSGQYTLVDDTMHISLLVNVLHSFEFKAKI